MRFVLSCYFITTWYFLILKLNHSFNKIIHLYTCLCYLHCVSDTSYSNSIFQAFIPVKIGLSCIPTNNDTEWRSGWTKIQKMCENVHPNLALVLLFIRTEVECGKGLSGLISKELGHPCDHLKLKM